MVLGLLGARIDNADDDEDVLELRADVLGRERKGSRFLEDDGHDVVPDVTLPQQLLPVVGRERQQRRHVKLQINQFNVIIQSELSTWTALVFNSTLSNRIEVYELNDLSNADRRCDNGNSE